MKKEGNNPVSVIFAASITDMHSRPSEIIFCPWCRHEWDEPMEGALLTVERSTTARQSGGRKSISGHRRYGFTSSGFASAKPSALVGIRKNPPKITEPVWDTECVRMVR
jgi:hypothetical protein